MRATSRRKVRTARAIVLAATLTSACGTRVDHDPPQAIAAPERPPYGVAKSSDVLPSPPVAGEQPSVAASQQGTALSARPPATAGGVSGASGGAVVPSSSLPAPAKPAKVPGVTPPLVDDPVSPPTAAPKSDVVIAWVGTMSGPAGEVQTTALRGVQYWVKSRNARGGLNGHPVRLLTYDSGGDAARYQAALREAVERHKAVAFLINPEVFGGASGVDYLTQQRVPQIGTYGHETWAYSSPMIFPHHSSGDLLSYTAIAGVAHQLVPTGKKRLGYIVCAEAQFCTAVDRVWSESATSLGFETVYRARAALTQPDFTAECLGARNAGAEVMLIALDTSSISRMAASCARQGYRPVFASLAQLLQDRMKEDQNLEGLVGSSTVFPYFQSGTPATDEFQDAVRRYGAGTKPGIGTSIGWSAAKLLERAGAALPEPPTSEALLRGLWTLNRETLGGLTLPLTFSPEKPATPQACWFNVTIQHREWLSRDGFQLICRDLPR